MTTNETEVRFSEKDGKPAIVALVEGRGLASYDPGLKLIDEISTDGIIPVAALLTPFLSELGDHALTGLTGANSVAERALRRTGAEVLVAGRDFGIGSSREQAVIALQQAGIKAVVAQRLGTIFEKNATNLNLRTATDLNVLGDIAAGLAVPLEKFLEGKDALTQQIIRSGGLFNFLSDVKNGKVTLPPKDRPRGPNQPQNVLEKRISSVLGDPDIQASDVVNLPVDLAATYVVLSHLVDYALSAGGKGMQPTLPSERVMFFEDHFGFSDKQVVHELTQMQREFAQRLGTSAQNYIRARAVEGGGEGISHRVIMERIDPKRTRVIVETDSHTPTLGALPVIPIPVGSTELAACIMEGSALFSVSRVLRVNLTGELPPLLTIRDAQIAMGVAIKPDENGMVVEYGGLNSLSIDEVAALCNMVPEIFLGLSALTESYKAGVEYLMNRFGMSKEEAEALYGHPDPRANYRQEVSFDLSSTTPYIALPGSVKNGIPLGQMTDHPEINAAYLISCTSGSADLRLAAAVLKGQQVSGKIRFIVSPSTRLIGQQSMDYLEILKDSGVTILESVCGACIGQGGGALEKNEIGITTSNRNEEGRMGDKSAQAYIAGPIIVALAAILGRIPTLDEFKQHSLRILSNLASMPPPENKWPLRLR